jgi:mutator protein MutT
VKTLVVAAAIISRDGRYLVTRRQQGAHLAGLWEFPGGKCEADETLAACLAREVWEELGVVASVGAEVFSVTHDYDDRRVALHFFECECQGEPTPQLGQQMIWIERSALTTLAFPPADTALIRLLMER